jgi:hypothetical protein
MVPDNLHQIRKEGNITLTEERAPITAKVTGYEILLETSQGRATTSRKWHASTLKDAERIFERIAAQDRAERLKEFLNEHS